MKRREILRKIFAVILALVMMVSTQTGLLYASEKSDDKTTVLISYVAGTGGKVSNEQEKILPEARSSIKGSKALPSEGWEFVCWEDRNGNNISTDAHLLPDISSSKESYTFKAIFKKLTTEPEDTGKHNKKDFSASSADGDATVDKTGGSAQASSDSKDSTDKASSVKIVSSEENNEDANINESTGKSNENPTMNESDNNNNGDSTMNESDDSNNGDSTMNESDDNNNGDSTMNESDDNNNGDSTMNESDDNNNEDSTMNESDDNHNGDSTVNEPTDDLNKSTAKNTTEDTSGSGTEETEDQEETIFDQRLGNIRMVVNATNAQDASAYFHASITSNKDTYASGSTAIYSVKYKLDTGSIHEGDYIYVTVPLDIVSSVDLSVSSQHFSSAKDMGNGKYKLTFGAGAESAISGSFSMFLTTADVEEQKNGTVTAGTDSSSITVNPRGPAGTGVFTDTIHKDAADNGSAVGFGDYDYSEGYGDSAAQIGILKSDPGSIKYRLYINDKEAEISNILVTDVLPDGMEFDPDKSVEVSDRNSGKSVDPGLYKVSLSGNTLIFTYPGTLTSALQINYWTMITSDAPLAGKYTNRVDITYEQEGTPYSEHRNYILQGSDYSAANGEKSVDKTEISADPEDQLVTYTIKFWNQNGFSAGEIALDDILDSHVKYISANANEYITIEQDKDDPQVIHLKNIKDISGSTTVYVRFICDFSDVPVGYTVENTVGGNTTKTRKIGGTAVISASKTVDNKTPTSEQAFEFELLDSAGTVIQTKQNEGSIITFDTLSYGKEDLGKSYTYQIREKAGQDTDYMLDDTIYTVTVAVASTADENGIIGTTVTYQKNRSSVNEASFNNTTAKISLPVKKVWDDANNQDGIRPGTVTVKLLADGKDTGKALTLSEENSWTGSFTELDQFTGGKEISYSIEEASVPGYKSTVSGSQSEGYRITNSHSPELTESGNQAGEGESVYTAIKSSDTANQKVKAGDQITYKITIKNICDKKLIGIWIRDYIPQYTKYVSAGTNGERGAIDGKQHVVWFISELDAGETTQVSFTVEVVDCLPDNTVIRNTAYTENTNKPDKPALNIPKNPKGTTNEVIHHFNMDKNSSGDTSGSTSGTTSGSTPKTGDNSNIFGYGLLMLISFMTFLLLLRKKRSYN